MILAVGGFLLQIFYVSGRLIYLNTMISRTKTDIGLKTSALNSNNTLVENYIWAQGVLEKMGQARKSEYRYKEYLLKINSWLTNGTSMVGVNFTKKDDISFVVFADSVDSYRTFETNINIVRAQEDFGFKKMEQQSLSRTADGSYKVTIILTI